MRKNMTAKLLSPALLLAASATLAAQEGEPMKAYISLGQNVAYGHSRTLAGKPWGGPGAYIAEFGLQFYHPATTLLVRPNAGYTRILSDPNKPETDAAGRVTVLAPTVYDLLGVFVGFDLVYNVSKKLPLTMTAGPSFHSWSVEQSNNVGWVAYDGYYGPTAQPGSARLMGEKRLKLGWRVGVGYDFKMMDRPFRVDFTYTMTEWRSLAYKTVVVQRNINGTLVNEAQRVAQPWVDGLNPSLPPYFSLKASYTF